LPGNVTTSTVTLTGTHTVTVQAAPVLLFGLPPELILIFTVAAVFVIWGFFRFQVKGVTVSLIWIYKNGSAIMLNAQQDLQGIFLYVIKGRRKVETLKKTGMPLQVRYLPPKFKAYMETPKNHALDDPNFKALREKGFKITPERHDRRGNIKAYLLEKDGSIEETFAYLDVNLGGLKTAQLYATVEGSGETMSWQKKIDDAPVDSGNTVVLQEMRTAAKGFFQLLAEAMQGSLKTFLLPLIAGLGIGGMVTVLLFILSGHLK
jgi:hypothetical protein